MCSSPKDALLINVSALDRRNARYVDDVADAGSAFQAHAAITGNARSPNGVRRVGGPSSL